MNLVAKSERMKAVLQMAEKVARTDVNVLITGESGTGKNTLADFIHQNSKRSSRNPVKIDCASLPKDLIEAELFGYEKGAFTGANETKIGWLETADKSTLFLDEIALLPFEAQAKLLRVLEQREVERLGGRKTIKIDVRILAATNVDLEKAVTEKRFREDLFFRLNVVRIEMPPLRERLEDIEDLAQYLLDFYTAKHGREKLSLSPEALKLLQTQFFTGNIRELSNLLERAVIVSTDLELKVESFPDYLQNTAKSDTNGWLTLAEIEANHVRETLKFTKGNKKEAANLLGISRKNLYERLERDKKKI